MRVAAGAGVNKILLTPGCVSMWNRKVMRSAAGVHFKVRITFTTWYTNKCIIIDV